MKPQQRAAFDPPTGALLPWSVTLSESLYGDESKGLAVILAVLRGGSAYRPYGESSHPFTACTSAFSRS